MAVTVHGAPPPPVEPGRRVPLSFGALAVLFVAVVVAQIAATGNPDLQTPVFGMCFLTLDVLALGLSLRAATHPRFGPAVRRPWRFMVPAHLLQLASTIGFAVGAIGKVGAAEWFGIVTRLAVAPIMLAAVLSFPMQRLSTSERYKLLLDVTTVAGGGFIALWYFIIGPALTSGHPATVAVSLAGFPLSDLVLVFGVSGVLMRGGAPSLWHPLTTLLAGLVCFLTADIYYSYQEVQHPGAELSLGIRLWLMSATFLIMAASAQQLIRGAGPAQRSAAGRTGLGGISQLPYAGLALGYLLLLFATAREGSLFPWGGLVAGVIVMTGAVAIRQLIAMRENHTLVVTDNLTGLANRVRLRTRLQQALSRQHGAAVLLIDLDGFKQVNDTLGHEAGDALLVAFSHALTGSIRPSDTAGRLGGDEFAVVLPEVTGVEQAGVVAARILAAAATGVRAGDTMMPIRASIGIALARPGEDAHAVLHRADVAMYAAKRTGSHGWLAYTDAMEDRLGADADLVRDLAAALAGEQLRLAYQPVVALSTGAVTAVRATVHWEHPTHGLLTSAVFLPAAERTPMAHDLTMWVLTRTCRHARPLRQAAAADLAMRACVRLHPGQLRRPDLTAEILAAVAAADFDPRDLILQVDGAALIQDEKSVDTLHELRAVGVRIAVDDFATGYACLSRRHRLPVDILTVGNCFVAELDPDQPDPAVAETVVRLSRLLHRDTASFLEPVTLAPPPRAAVGHPAP